MLMVSQGVICLFRCKLDGLLKTNELFSERLALKLAAIGVRVATVLGNIHAMRKIYRKNNVHD